MLGQIMEMKTKDGLKIRLASFSKEDAQAFITDGGMQQRSVTRYVSSPSAPTIEDEHAWYDKIRDDKRSIVWGIWDFSAGQPKLIGNSTIFKIQEFPIRQAISGSVISDKKYWGKGIATVAHKARTWYAFNEIGLTRIKSAVATPNIASKKALEKSGYFLNHVERNTFFTEGKLLHQENLECLNPAESEWKRWWNDDEPTPEAIKARETTLAALEWARENVTLL